MSLYLDSETKTYTSQDEIHQCLNKWSEELSFNSNYTIHCQKNEKTNCLAIRVIRGFAFSDIFFKSGAAEQKFTHSPAGDSKKLKQYSLSISGIDLQGNNFTLSTRSYYSGYSNYHKSASCSNTWEMAALT